METLYFKLYLTDFIIIFVNPLRSSELALARSNAYLNKQAAKNQVCLGVNQLFYH